MANIIAKVEVITPEVAKCYLEHNEGNRVVNKSMVAFYSKMMTNGEWQVNGEAIVFDKNGRLVNGQHRLEACIYANIPFETLVVRGVDELSFYTFDQGSKRKAADVFKIADIPNGSRVSAIISKYIALINAPGQNSLSANINNAVRKEVLSTSKESNGFLLAEYNKNPDYWQKVNTFASACYARCRLLMTSYVGGVTAYLNLVKGYEIEYVMDFFSQLFYEETTELEVIRLLRRKLIDDAMRDNKIRLSPTYKEQLLIVCWELYKQGRDSKVLRWSPNTDKVRTLE